MPDMDGYTGRLQARFLKSSRRPTTSDIICPALKEFPRYILQENILPKAELIDEFLVADRKAGNHANNEWPALIAAAFPELKNRTLAEMLAALVCRAIWKSPRG